MNDSIFAKVGIPIAIILVALGLSFWLYASKPTPESIPYDIPAFLVDAQPVNVQPVNFSIESQGNVLPRNRTNLSVEVRGKVVALSDNFVVGGRFKKGDVLAQLEQADYLTEVQLAEARLAEAQASLEEEVARGKVAEQEWRSVNNVPPPELGLRKPQLKREQANVKAATASLAQAKRNLSRTKIVAPYNGIVVSREIDLGQFVSVGAQAGLVYSTDVAEVRLPITDRDLAFVDVQHRADKKQAEVKLVATVGGVSRVWKGGLARTEGVLDTTSRVVYAVVEVTQPYDGHSTPLRFGQFVQAYITSPQTQQLMVLPRTLLRFDNTILTVNDDREIQIKSVEVARTTTDSVFIHSGLLENDLVVTSPVPNPYDGMKVRLPDDLVNMPSEAQNDQKVDEDKVSAHASQSEGIGES